jgi:hypothetical protein
VDIQQSAAECGDEHRGQDTHESGEYHQVHAVVCQAVNQRLVEGFPAVVFAVIDATGGDAGVGRALQPRRLRVIADDDTDAGIQLAAGAGVDKRLHIGSAAGNEDGQAGFARGGHGSSSTSLLPALIVPISQAA